MRRRRKMTPTTYPPTPKCSSRVGEMSNEEEEEDDPHPLPTPPQMVLTVKNSRWVIICVFHAHLPCIHYTAVPAYWDPEGLASCIQAYCSILGEGCFAKPPLRSKFCGFHETPPNVSLWGCFTFSLYGILLHFRGVSFTKLIPVSLLMNVSLNTP